MEQLLTVRQVARLVGKPKSTVYRWATEYAEKGYGPRPFRSGGAQSGAPALWVYREADVTEWVAARRAELDAILAAS